ncbi:hypothetical protein GCM10010353_17110 [Streptomyces chryseus]|nr:hypothetical protein GCM10010353_17110 [Streptomyces chryseus]
MHAAFAAFAAASMVGAFAALDRMRPTHATALALALGFIAGCALANAL